MCVKAIYKYVRNRQVSIMHFGWCNSSGNLMYSISNGMGFLSMIVSGMQLNRFMPVTATFVGCITNGQTLVVHALGSGLSLCKCTRRAFNSKQVRRQITSGGNVREGGRTPCPAEYRGIVEHSFQHAFQLY